MKLYGIRHIQSKKFLKVRFLDLVEDVKVELICSNVGDDAKTYWLTPNRELAEKVAHGEDFREYSSSIEFPLHYFNHEELEVVELNVR